MREPGVAAVLSAIIPGLGQFYNGRFLAGILWLIITPGLWIGTGGLLGWVCHVISAYTAYTYARDHSGQPWKRWSARSILRRQLLVPTAVCDEVEPLTIGSVELEQKTV